MNEHFEAMLFGVLAEIPYLPGAGANAENVVNTATQADGSERVSFSLRNLFRKAGKRLRRRLTREQNTSCACSTMSGTQLAVAERRCRSGWRCRLPQPRSLPGAPGIDLHYGRMPAHHKPYLLRRPPSRRHCERRHCRLRTNVAKSMQSEFCLPAIGASAAVG